MSYLAYSFLTEQCWLEIDKKQKKIVPKEMGTMSVTELILVSKE